ncbi:MAG: nucleoside hydrolase [Lachnospiraceae bacterium]|nr:nucleoside hydrolase [Lachnospiraceae bacterium]
MKNNALIKLLLVSYLVIGIIGIVRYLTPSVEKDFSDAAYTARRSPQEHENGTNYLVKKTDEAELQTETDAEPSNVFSAGHGEFVPDMWKNQIASFLSEIDTGTDAEDEYTNKNASSDIGSSFTKTSIPKLIIDTDFASDADDVVAVRLAMCFQDLGLADIQGIALSTTYSRSPLAIHALCSQDGYENIPVAMDTSGNGVQVHTDYVDVMYDMPKSRDDFEQPVQMYRRILAESDTKVNIITLGFLQNIQALMRSAPDQYSPFTGAELIAQKVDTIYIVGGNSTGKPSFNFYWTGEKVIEAAKTVVRDFPARIVFLQTDLSDDTYCGQFYNTKDPHQRDIVTKALKANNQGGGIVAWDVFSVWCAVQDMNGNTKQTFLSLERGTQYVSDTGATKWTAGETGRHFKLYKNAEGAYYSELMNNMLLQKYSHTHDR